MLSQQAIANSITINENVKVISQLVSAGVFYISDSSADNLLLNQINGSNLERKEKAVLELIYLIRCNLSHGEKSLKETQKRILIPCIDILTEINQMMFENMKA